jgi:hypothetical protein
MVPLTEKAAYWTDSNGKICVFLIQRTAAGQSNFTLFVVGPTGLKVTYRSKVNSVTPIVLELTPKVESAIEGMQEYEFKHSFSKTTIWMALTFEKTGHHVEDLTRTFYGGIDKVVCNEQFLEGL